MVAVEERCRLDGLMAALRMTKERPGNLCPRNLVHCQFPEIPRHTRTDFLALGVSEATRAGIRAPRLFFIRMTESTGRSRLKWSVAPFRFRLVAVVATENDEFSTSLPKTSTATVSAMRLVRRLAFARGLPVRRSHRFKVTIGRLSPSSEKAPDGQVGLAFRINRDYRRGRVPNQYKLRTLSSAFRNQRATSFDRKGGSPGSRSRFSSSVISCAVLGFLILFNARRRCSSRQRPALGT
jgi:hypothetical protein